MGGLPKQKPFSRLLYFNEISSSSLFSLSIQILLHWDFNTFQTIFCALPYIHIQIYTQTIVAVYEQSYVSVHLT